MRDLRGNKADKTLTNTLSYDYTLVTFCFSIIKPLSAELDVVLTHSTNSAAQKQLHYTDIPAVVKDSN